MVLEDTADSPDSTPSASPVFKRRCSTGGCEQTDPPTRTEQLEHALGQAEPWDAIGRVMGLPPILHPTEGARDTEAAGPVMVAHLPMDPEILPLRGLNTSIHGPRAMVTEPAEPNAPTPPLAPAASDETTSLLRELVRGQLAIADTVQSLVTRVSAIEQGKPAAPPTISRNPPPPPQPIQGKGSSTIAPTPAATRATQPAKGKATGPPSAPPPL